MLRCPCPPHAVRIVLLLPLHLQGQYPQAISTLHQFINFNANNIAVAYELLGALPCCSRGCSLRGLLHPNLNMLAFCVSRPFSASVRRNRQVGGGRGYSEDGMVGASASRYHLPSCFRCTLTAPRIPHTLLNAVLCFSLQGLRNCGAMDTARLHASLGQVYRKKGAYLHHDARVLLKASVNVPLPPPPLQLRCSDTALWSQRCTIMLCVVGRDGGGELLLHGF